MLLIVISIVVLVVVILVITILLHRQLQEKRTMRNLSAILFPSGEDQKEEIIDEIDAITQGRFTRDEMLDYYLKIKGLQIVDFHTNADSGMRRFLMQPTKIRLNYFEQVKFYETFLSYSQAEGISLV